MFQLSQLCSLQRKYYRIFKRTWKFKILKWKKEKKECTWEWSDDEGRNERGLISSKGCDNVKCVGSFSLLQIAISSSSSLSTTQRWKINPSLENALKFQQVNKFTLWQFERFLFQKTYKMSLILQGKETSTSQ
jgi:hypothetical protein